MEKVEIVKCSTDLKNIYIYLQTAKIFQSLFCLKIRKNNLNVDSFIVSVDQKLNILKVFGGL